MAKKPPATEAKTKAAPAEVKKEAVAKAHASKPGINPFVQQHPGKPGRSAAGDSFNSRRNTKR